MKNFKLITPILLTAVMVLAAGCGEDPVRPVPNPVPNVNPAPGIQWDDEVNGQLVGLWLFVAASVDGRDADLAEVLDLEDGAVGAAFGIADDGWYGYLEFDSDGETILFVEGTVQSGGNHLKISGPDVAYSGTWKRSGDTLTLQATIEGKNTKLQAERYEADGGAAVLNR